MYIKADYRSKIKKIPELLRQNRDFLRKLMIEIIFSGSCYLKTKGCLSPEWLIRSIFTEPRKMSICTRIGIRFLSAEI